MDRCSMRQIGPRVENILVVSEQVFYTEVCYDLYIEWKLDSRSMNLNVHLYIIMIFNPAYTFCIKIEFHFKSRNKLTRIFILKIIKSITLLQSKSNKPDNSHIT